MARIVFGEQCRRVDLEVEEIPDGVPILGAIESVEGVGAAGIRFFCRQLVERRTEHRYEAFELLLRRPILADGRHLPGREFANDTLPFDGVCL